MSHRLFSGRHIRSAHQPGASRCAHAQPLTSLLDLQERVFATGGPIHPVRHVDRLLVLGISVTVRR